MARGTQDVIGFTRIFVLFCTLVLLPALLMSGFGVVAILNVRQAEKQRRREGAEEVLRRAERRFIAVVDRSDRALRAGLANGAPPEDVVAQARANGAPVAAWLVIADDRFQPHGTPPFVEGPPESLVSDDKARTNDESLLKLLTRLSEGATPLRPAHVTVEHPAFAGVVSLQRLSDGRTLIYAIDEPLLTARMHAKDEVSGMTSVLRVVPASDLPIANALDRLMKEMVDDKADASALAGHEELVARRLDPPFERFTLAVEAPPSSDSKTTIVVYIILLVLFLGTLITGVVITARLIWHETRLSRLKTDFVSHMSHELRTPLAAIRLFIDTLRLGRTASEDERQECLDLLSKESERLSEMIERVLGYARLKAGRRLFSLRAVPVKAIVDDAIEAFRAQTVASPHAGTLVLEADVDADLPDVLVDREAVVEALLNLLGNAFKYTGADKHIVVFAHHGSSGRRKSPRSPPDERGKPPRRLRVWIGVRDNGPGLPKAEHTRIFERFYQSGSLLSSKQPGSGLGLAITKAIIEGQGGKIFVDSEAGQGASFTFELRPARKPGWTASQPA